MIALVAVRERFSPVLASQVYTRFPLCTATTDEGRRDHRQLRSRWHH